MIVSPQNEKLKLVKKLARRRSREREGLFVAEGEDLVVAALAAGSEPRFLLRAAGAEDVPGAEIAEEVEPDLLASVSSLGSGCRILGVWPERWADAPSGSVCVHLDGVADPGNVGAIVRSADALLDVGVTLGPSCADPYGPKAIRASMGSIFARPPVRISSPDSLPRPLVGLAAHGGQWPPEQALAAAVAAAAEATDTGAESFSPRLTLCLGSERDGLAPETAAACDLLLTIPLAGAAESLNVAAAAAICLERVSSLAVLATGSDLDSSNEGTDA